MGAKEANCTVGSKDSEGRGQHKGVKTKRKTIRALLSLMLSN